MSAAPTVRACDSKSADEGIARARSVSEKSTYVGEKTNRYIFRVVSDATKPEIKAAVELHVRHQGPKRSKCCPCRVVECGRARKSASAVSWAGVTTGRKLTCPWKAGQEINFAAGESK